MDSHHGDQRMLTMNGEMKFIVVELLLNQLLKIAQKGNGDLILLITANLLLLKSNQNAYQ
jgi:hypothetical protein